MVYIHKTIFSRSQLTG